MDDEVIREIYGRSILHWNFRGYAELPEELRDHGGLVQELYLKWNHLITLPVWIKDMTSLTNIYLFGNNLRYLPEEIGELRSLTTLDLQNNSLEALPESITDLRNLNFLNLQFNSLYHLPKDLSNWKALYSLNLKGNHIKKVPESICYLNSLQELILDSNLITDLPRNIVYLPNLSYFTISDNRLVVLPSIWFINNAVFVFTHNPDISHIPFEIGQGLTKQCNMIVHGDVWFFSLEGCMEELLSGKEDLPNLQLLVEDHDTTSRLVLPLPLTRVFGPNEKYIPSLYELCLRRSHSLLFTVSDPRVCHSPILLSSVPLSLAETLVAGPTARCHLCSSDVFTQSTLWLVPRHVVTRDTTVRAIASIHFCSYNCSKSFAANEPSIYPYIITKVVDWFSTLNT